MAANLTRPHDIQRRCVKDANKVHLLMANVVGRGLSACCATLASKHQKELVGQPHCYDLMHLLLSPYVMPVLRSPEKSVPI
jgi:hypothetical protein